MSMSTNISDLPGPLPEIKGNNAVDDGNYNDGNYDDGNYDDGNYDDGNYDDGNYDDGNYDDGNYDDGNYEDGNKVEVENYIDINKNLKKLKKVSIFQSIKNEINEKNLILFIIIFLATLPFFTTNIIKVINVLPFKDMIPKSNLTISFIKSLVLIIVYILIKKFML